MIISNKQNIYTASKTDKTCSNTSVLLNNNRFIKPLSDIERRVLITTVPFGEIDRKPLELLEMNGIDYEINPLGRKLNENELVQMVKDFGIIIAGTEPNTSKVMSSAPHLRFISRVGVGLDNVDLITARKQNIMVSYTPEAPAPAVAELTIGMILSLIRHIAVADRGLRHGKWHRHMGYRLSNMTIGIIGLGRIGKQVVKHLNSFNPKILVNDIDPDFRFLKDHSLEFAEKEKIFKEADIITLHIPLTAKTHNLIDIHSLGQIKKGSFIVNTSRGEVINEAALVEALKSGHLGGAVLDVFEQEPYQGELTKIDNCLLTCHMGSCSRDCRAQMELEATQEAIRFIKGEPLLSLVPNHEYRGQTEGD